MSRFRRKPSWRSCAWGKSELILEERPPLAAGGDHQPDDDRDRLVAGGPEPPGESLPGGGLPPDSPGPGHLLDLAGGTWDRLAYPASKKSFLSAGLFQPV